MKALAGIAAQDPSARTMEVLGGVALRTHEVRDGSPAFKAEVDDAPISAEERAQLHAEATRVPMLRARYTLPGAPGKPWTLVVFTALIGEDEPQLHELYLGLFDAFVQAMRRADA